MRFAKNSLLEDIEGSDSNGKKWKRVNYDKISNWRVVAEGDKL